MLAYSKLSIAFDKCFRITLAQLDAFALKASNCVDSVAQRLVMRQRLKQSDIDDLFRDLHVLVTKLHQHPYGYKLGLGVKRQLELYVAYKRKPVKTLHSRTDSK